MSKNVSTLRLSHSQVRVNLGFDLLLKNCRAFGGPARRCVLQHCRVRYRAIVVRLCTCACVIAKCARDSRLVNKFRGLLVHFHLSVTRAGIVFFYVLFSPLAISLVIVGAFLLAEHGSFLQTEEEKELLKM